MRTSPRNPYIAGKALNDARGFFGHGDVFRLVETVLSSPDQNSVVLFGQRRTTARQRVSRVVRARRSRQIERDRGQGSQRRGQSHRRVRQVVDQEIGDV